MKNLAGVDDCDVTIKEELHLAGIESVPLKGEGEVPFKIAGRIGNWKLTRAWTYWVASVEHISDGLPLKDAVVLHETPNPANPKQTLGQVIRSGGDCTCPSPTGYTAQPVYDEELNKKLMALGYKKKALRMAGLPDVEFVDINVGEIATLCNDNKLDVERYVETYHIDSQVGLTEFAKFLNPQTPEYVKLIKKYEGILKTLKHNRSNCVEGDQYDYETDIKNCAQFIRDLKALKK